MPKCYGHISFYNPKLILNKTTALCLKNINHNSINFNYNMSKIPTKQYNTLFLDHCDLFAIQKIIVCKRFSNLQTIIINDPKMCEKDPYIYYYPHFKHLKKSLCITNNYDFRNEFIFYPYFNNIMVGYERKKLV